MFGRDTRINRSAKTASPSKETIQKLILKYVSEIEQIFTRFSKEDPFFHSVGDWNIVATKSTSAESEDFCRHLEIQWNGKSIALIDLRILDKNLVGSIAIFDWRGLSVEDCDWLLFGLATMLAKSGLRQYEAAKQRLRLSMNETVWNTLSGVKSTACPRASISVPMSEIEPLSAADWHHLDDLKRG